ncbi:VOC family protein [Sphingorhabdus sp.]|jgi:glyoxylase I family protein|uniref:VOC family protein n=1 Tax=Sphingorhabdus sp. TaxID=1902408 RepID=UPI0037CA55EE
MAAIVASPSLDVGLVTNDIEGQTRFYSGTLGLEIVGRVEIPGVGTITRFKAGNSVLRVLVPLKPAAAASRDDGFAGTVGIRYVALKVTDLADLVRRVANAGHVITVPVRNLRPGVDVALVEDADGNVVELMEEHAL